MQYPTNADLSEVVILKGHRCYQSSFMTRTSHTKVAPEIHMDVWEMSLEITAGVLFLPARHTGTQLSTANCCPSFRDVRKLGKLY